MRSYFGKGFFFSFLFVAVTGCKTQLSPGLYVGNVSKKENQHLIHIPVSIHVSLPDGFSARFEVQDLHKKTLDTGVLSWDSLGRHVTLKIPEVIPEAMKLDPFKLKDGGEIHWKCYQGASHLLTVSACLSKNNFGLTVTDSHSKDLVYSLSTAYSEQQTSFILEEPRHYTLSEALERITLRNFDSRIEYERLLQSKAAARTAYLNLLPQINIRGLFSVPSLSPSGVFSVISNFVPFLIPTRWMRAGAAVQIREAEQATLDILKADLTAQVSGLAYVFTQDQADLGFFREIHQRSSIVLKHILSQVSEDPLLIAEADFRMGILVNIMEQEIVRLDSSLEMDKTALSLSLGYHNPQGVAGISIEESMSSIAETMPLNREEIAQAALERSLELRQINHLLNDAHIQKEMYYFNWTDPDAPASMSISFGLIGYMQRAQAFINELQTRRERTQSQILQTAENAVITYNMSLERYQKMIIGRELLSRKIEQSFDTILATTKATEMVASSGILLWILPSYIKNRTSIHAQVTQFRMARTQIKRLLLEDYYAQFQP